VIAENIDVTGRASTTSHGTFSTTIDHETPNADPLGLGLPPVPSPTFGAVNYTGSAPLTLNAGTYVGGIKISGTGPVTLNPGVYYMKGGGFSVGGQASVNGNHVLIVNASVSSSDSIGVSGQAHVTLTGLTSGPDKGLVMLQTSANPVSFNGQSAVITLTGVVYVPNALVSISGNAFMTIDPGAGTATLPPILVAMIAFDLHVGTNGVLVINPDDPSAGPMTATAAGVATTGSLIGSSLLSTGSQPTGGSSSVATPSNLALPVSPPVSQPYFSASMSVASDRGWNLFAHAPPADAGSEFDIFAGNVL